MRVPFYLNFKDFEADYYDNLEKWFENQGNTSETDFLLYIKDMYKEYVCYSFSEDKLVPEANVELQNYVFPNYEKYGLSFGAELGGNAKFTPVAETKTISMMEYAQYILDSIHDYLSKNKITMKENQTISDYLHNSYIICEKRNLGFYIDSIQHQKKLPFLNAFLSSAGNTVSMSLYRIFYNSVTKIVDFIDFKLKEVEAFEQSVFYELKSEAFVKRHFKNQNYLTIFN